MDINLAGNVLFNAFEQFANAQMGSYNEKAVSRSGAGEHNIVAATSDRVAALYRSQDDKTANNNVRTVFRNMIAQIFGGINQIPENVMQVMKMHDYDHGRPLTARRISAVCTQVRICAERERQNQQAQAIQENLSKAQSIGRLLRGESVADIVGEGRGAGWDEYATHLVNVLTSAVKNAENVMPGTTVPIEHPFEGGTVLSCGPEGNVLATITVGEQIIVDTGKRPDQFSDTLISSLVALDSEFADVQVNGIGMGRSLLATKTLPQLREHACLPDSEPCALRSFACALLIAKADVTKEQLDEFTNVQLANFAQSLLENPPDNDLNVKEAIEAAIKNKYVELQNIGDDIENHGENHVVIKNELQIDGEQPPNVVQQNVPQPLDEPPKVPNLVIPKPPPQVPPPVPNYDVMPYVNPAINTATTYKATIVGNKLLMMLIELRNESANAAVKAHEAVRLYAKANLDIMVLIANKTVTVGSATSPNDENEKVESILAPNTVSEIAQDFIDEFSDNADLSTLTNGKVAEIKKALVLDDERPGITKVAEKADHAYIMAKLKDGYFNQVVTTTSLRDDVEVITKKYESDSAEYPIPPRKVSKEVVSFLETMVDLSEKAVKEGTVNKTFAPGSNGARIAERLLAENEDAKLPQVLKDQEKAKALRKAFDANYEYFIRFIFDRDNAISGVPLPLREEIGQLADRIRGMMVEMTGCVALAGKEKLSALSGDAVEAIKSFLKNDVALERMAQLFAVATPTSDIFKSRFAPKAKEAENVRLLKDDLDAIPANEVLARDPDYVSFASPQGFRSVVQQFAQIATNPAMQKPENAKELLTANNNRVLKAILASLSNPSLINSALVPQMRKVVRNLTESIVRLLSNELPERKMDFAKLSKGDIDAICSLFTDPMTEIDPAEKDPKKLEELKNKAVAVAAKRTAALGRAMPGISTLFTNFQKEVGNAVQDLVNKVFNLGALNVNGVVKSPYDTMSPAEIKERLDKLDLDAILDEGNIDPNRPGTLTFTMNILQNYFSKLKPEAMRDILANALCTEPVKGGEAQVDGDCRLLFGVFQGTGPLLQKMLQGLDKRVLAPEYRDTFGKVLDNMKSSMQPLTDEYVNDRLEAFMKQSGGKVYYMKAGQSLGAATVGQTFLCKMKHKVVEKGFLRNTERNVEEEVVVKIRRPNIDKIAKAEKEVFDEAAKKVPGMESAWKAQYASIEKEFDFRNEAKNVKDGAFYQVAGTKVDIDIAPNLHVMTLPDDTSASEEVIVLKKAKGVPLDKEISDMRNRLRVQFSKVFQTDPETGLWKTDEKGKLLVRPDVKPNELFSARNASTQLVEGLFRSVRLLKHASAKWMKEAFFNSGCFHNDLHGGNLMVDIGKSSLTDAVTMIDFGNLMKLEQGDRSNLCNMLIYSAARDVDSFCDELFALIDAHAKTTAISLSNGTRAKIRAMVDSILHKGKAGDDAGYRFLAILEELRKFGVTLPESIYGVSRGLSRLQSSLDDMADIINKTHAVYSAFFGDVDSVLPTDGIFGKDNIYGGFLGKLYGCMLSTSTGKDAKAKIDALIEDVTNGHFDIPVGEYIMKIIDAKDFGRGAEEIDALADMLHVKKEYRPEVQQMWTKLSILASNENPTEKEKEEIDNLVNEIAEKITDWEWAGCVYYQRLAEKLEDPNRIFDEQLNTYTSGKKKGQTYIYKEWESRVWSLPEVISSVVNSATSGFFDKASFVSKLGYKKAMQTFEQIENGKDMPLGHKKIAA